MKIRNWRSLGVLLAAIALFTSLFFIIHKKPVEPTTTTVAYGPVREIVSVSGIAEAKEKAELAFPVVGVSESILVEVGEIVEAGEILAVLDTSALESNRKEALAGLVSAVAERGALINGPTESTRDVTSATVQLKKDALATTKLTEESKLANARRALLSSGLTAYTDDGNEEATAPDISGSYSCDQEGTYTISVYRSEAESGYSYRVSGLETGTFSATTNQPSPLGTCGLRLQFEDGVSYSNTIWHIDVPNRQAPAYVVNKNTYELTEVQARSAIALAEQEVRLAEANESKDNQSPRPELLTQADAKVTQAQAKIERVEAEIEDRVMRAPFSGTVTDINLKEGEVASTEPIMTLVTGGEFDITARIPEIDIGKLSPGQSVDMVFDARSNETLRGTLAFVSLTATTIDGVSYFDAYITPETKPDWLRNGLNADIDIVVAEKQNNLRLPKRFVFDTGNGFAILKKTGDTFATSTVDVVLEGNDGFVALSGVSEGDVVAAP